MPLFAALLLQAQSQNADVRFAEWALRLIPIALSIYVLFSGRSRESRKALDKNIADLLLFRELQQGLNTQHQLATEKIGDEVKRNHQEHESKLTELNKISQDVAVVKERLANYGAQVKEINDKIDRLLDRK